MVIDNNGITHKVHSYVMTSDYSLHDNQYFSIPNRKWAVMLDFLDSNQHQPWCLHCLIHSQERYISNYTIIDICLILKKGWYLNFHKSYSLLTYVHPQVPKGAESCIILVATVDFLTAPLVVWMRLKDTIVLHDACEIAEVTPTRFVGLILRPLGETRKAMDMGKVLGTLMSDQVKLLSCIVMLKLFLQYLASLKNSNKMQNVKFACRYLHL